MMSSKIFTMTATSIALITGLGTSAFAQDNAQSVELPGVLQALELTDVDVKKGPRGAQKIEGDLPGGGEIEAILDKENNVLMIRGRRCGPAAIGAGRDASASRARQ